MPVPPYVFCWFPSRCGAAEAAFTLFGPQNFAKYSWASVTDWIRVTIKVRDWGKCPPDLRKMPKFVLLWLNRCRGGVSVGVHARGPLGFGHRGT